jgi:peptidoglycan/LPS O-acetylase OafA/YrhL
MSERALSQSPTRESRLAWLDALRGFAALCVVFDHGSTSLLRPARDFVYHWVDFGQYGVFLFFLVSGYIVPASLERKGSVRGFWTSRLFRLYPMYVFVLVLSAVAYATRYGSIEGAEHDPVTSVTSWPLMLQNMLAGPNVPTVTWTLSYEMAFYLLIVALFSWRVHQRSGGYAIAFAAAAVALGGVLPMYALSRWARSPHGPGGIYLNVTVDVLVLAGIALSLSHRTAVARVGATAAAVIALVLLTVNQGWPYPWSGLEILAMMFTGTFIYRTQLRLRTRRQEGQEGKASRNGMVGAVAVVLVVLALITLAVRWHGEQRHLAPIVVRQLTDSPLLAAATFGVGLAVALSRWRVPRWCAWLGVISYSIYLLHPLVFNAWRLVPGLHRLHYPLSGQGVLFAIQVGLIVALSAVTYYLIERPMQRLGRRIASYGTGAVASPAPVDSPVPVDSPAAATPAGNAVPGVSAPAAPDAAATRNASSSRTVAGGSGGSP